MIHLHCTRTDRLYRVVGWSAAEKTITLRGEHGDFVEPLRPVAELEAMGYTRIVGPIEGAIGENANG